LSRTPGSTSDGRDLPALRTQAGLQELSDEDLEKVAGGGTTTELIGSAATVAVGVAAAALV
jgi:lactobin A/cerein 7B family class IIb bacteriocin